MGGGTLDGKVTERKGLTLGNKLAVGGLLLMSFSAAAFLWIDDYRAKKEKDELYNKVSLIANTNNDNVTDAKEWANVYDSLGLTYDVHYSDPKKDLGTEKMEKYLER